MISGYKSGMKKLNPMVIELCGESVSFVTLTRTAYWRREVYNEDAIRVKSAQGFRKSRAVRRMDQNASVVET